MSNRAQAYRGFAQKKLLILFTVQPAATNSETKSFFQVKNKPDKSDKSRNVDIRALQYSNHKLNLNLWFGSKR